MNHKRKRPKARRAGCLVCKPNKLNANKTSQRKRNRRAWQNYESQGLPSRHEERS